MIKKLEKMRKLGTFIVENEKKIQEELTEVEDLVAFQGDDMSEEMPKLTELKAMTFEPVEPEKPE